MTALVEWDAFLELIKESPTYSIGVAFGKPRTGHPEGVVLDHILELTETLNRLSSSGLVDDVEIRKLQILINVHDTMKFWAAKVPISDPRSHSSLAAKFLADIFGSRRTNLPEKEMDDLVEMVRYHDEGYALWHQVEKRGFYNVARMENVLGSINDLELFLLFTLIDGFTAGKEHSNIRWFADQVNAHLSRLGKPGADRVYTAMEVLGI